MKTSRCVESSVVSSAALRTRCFGWLRSVGPIVALILGGCNQDEPKPNQAPVAVSDAFTLDEDTSRPIPLRASDADGNGLSFTIVSGPAHGKLTGSAPSLIYTPAADFNGSDAFTFKANDGALDSSPATISLTITPVNDAPIALPRTVSASAGRATAIALAGSDVDGDPLTFVVVTSPQHGQLTGVAPNLTYSANPNYAGADGFTFTVSDGAVVSATAAIAITVTTDSAGSSNHSPNANAQTASVVAGSPVNLILSGSDPDGDVLSFVITRAPAHGALSGIPPILSYTPASGFVGIDEFAFTVKDASATSAAAIVTLMVTVQPTPTPAPPSPTPVGSPTPIPTITATPTPVGSSSSPTPTPLPGSSGPTPTATPTPSPTPTPSGSPTPTIIGSASPTPTPSVSITNRVPVAINQAVLATAQIPKAITLAASDADGNALTYAIAALPAHGSLSGSAPNVSYTSAAGFSGTDTFTFTASDGLSTSAPATVTITVSSAPVTALVEILMPTHGCVENYARPDLGAHYAGSAAVRPDSFRIYLDGKDFSSETMIEDGEVMFMPRFNLANGSHSYRVDWVSGGQIIATDTVAFSVAASIVGTRFEGEVRDYNGAPLRGVVVKAAGLQTTTGSNGKYAFDNLPVGETVFRFLTDSVAGPYKYAPVTLSFEIFANVRTRWARAVYLPIVDESKGVLVHSNWPSDQVVTNPDIAGVKLMIPANTTVTFPSGAAQAIVTLIDIPIFRSPNCLGPGVTPTRLYATQPEDTKLSQPAVVEMPNDLGAPEGAVAQLWNLNKQSGRYEESGVMEVKGGKLVSRPGSGLLTFDWHGMRDGERAGASNSSAAKSQNEDETTVCSYSALRFGSLEEDHAVPAYQSVGTARSTFLHYSSLVAAPNLVSNAEITKAKGSMSASRVSYSATIGNVGSGITYYAPPAVAAGVVDTFTGAAVIDTSGATSGLHALTSRVTSFYPPLGQLTPLPDGNASYSREFTEPVIIINGAELFPAMGRGWNVANIDRLLIDATGVVRVGGGGDVERYTAVGMNNDTQFRGDFGFENLPLGTVSRAGSVLDLGELRAVDHFGFIQPPEGSRMLLGEADPNGIPADFAVRPPDSARLRSAAESKPRSRAIGAGSQQMAFTIPLSVVPGGTRISVEVDVLTDRDVGDVSPLLQVVFFTAGGGGVTVPARNYGPIATILPGADTGYARRTGFQQYIIDVPARLAGQSGFFQLYLNAAGSGPTKNVACAVLFDHVTAEPADPNIVGNYGVFSSENGSFDTLVFDVGGQRYVRTEKDGTARVFDLLGREISVSDRWQNKTTYTYVDGDGDGRPYELASITDPVGLVTSLAYAGGKLTSVTDPAGRVTAFDYAAGMLTRITNPDHTTRAFSYDAKGRMLSQSDGKAQTRYYAYSAAGRIASVTRADGSVFEYIAAQEKGLPADGLSTFAAGAPLVRTRSAEILTAEGQLTSNNLDRNGRPTQTTDALGRVTTTIYDSQQMPIEVQQPNGNITRFAYDFQGNLISRVNAFNGARAGFSYLPTFNLLTSSSDPLNRKTAYEYDSKGSLTKVTDALNQTVTMTYNTRGQVLTITDQRGKTTTLTYDGNGRQSTVTDPLNRVTTYTYTSEGNVATVRDPLGHTTTVAYDAGNQITQITLPDGGITRFAYDGNNDLTKVTDAIGHETLTEYDVRRRPVKTMDALGRITLSKYDTVDNLVESVDAAGGRWSTTYNGVNQKVSTQDPLGQRTQFGYDLVDNLDRVTTPDGAVTKAVYDPLSRVTSAVAPDGATTTYAYDLADQRTSVTDAIGGTMRYTFDQLGRVLTIKDALSRTTAFVYDGAGHLTKWVRPNNATTLSEFDAAGQLVQTTAADGGVVTYGYDAVGNLITLTDTNSRVRRFGYDVLNRQQSETDALGRVSSVVRDLVGNVTQITRRDGQVITRTYDAVNRVLQVSLPAVNGLSADTQTFSYDALGNIIGVADGDTQVTTTFDALSRPLSTSQAYNGNAQTISFTYDTMNRRSTMSDPTGTTRYGYDSSSRLTQLTDPAGRTYRFAYDPLSRVTSRTLPNGVIGTFGYDAASQLLAITHKQGGVTIDSVNYTYNTVGNRTTESRADGNTRSFGYDAVDRVTSASNSLQIVPAETFSYDREGNWTIGGRTHDAANQLSGDGLFAYSYDAQGNLTRKASLLVPSDVTTYVYDASDRLVRVVTPSTTTDYRYDGFGRRVAKIVGGIVTRYVLDGGNAHLELDGGGALLAANHHAGIDDLLARDVPAGSAFVLGDGLSSTTALTDTAGAVTERYRYSSFGEPQVLAPDFSARAAPPKQAYTYTGRDWEPETGLYFYRARFYSPTMGRFISEDPVGLSAGRNAYSYVSNRPTGAVDPSGTHEIDVHRFLTQYLARQAGFSADTAEQIGRATQALDDDNDPRDAQYGGLNPENMRNYHFVSPDRLVELRDAAFAPRSSFTNVGNYFHALEDTYPHSKGIGDRNWQYYADFSGVMKGSQGIGHGWEGHEPDWTWSDVDKSMAMARETHRELMNLAKSRGVDTSQAPRFSAICSQLRRFMAAKVDTQIFRYAKQTATIQGYDEKIKILDPAFLMDFETSKHQYPFRQSWFDYRPPAPYSSGWNSAFLNQVRLGPNE